MKINIKATNLKLTLTLREYIEEKIGGLEKFVHRIKAKSSSKKGKPPIEAWVEVGRTTYHHHKGRIFRAECQIKFPGKSIRAESTRKNIHLAIDEVKEELQREIRRYTEKKDSKYKRTARRIKRLLKLSPLARFRR